IEGARTALKRLAGTLDEITPGGQKFIDQLEKQNEQLRLQSKLIGLSAVEAQRVKLRNSIDFEGLSASDIRGIREKVHENLELARRNSLESGVATVSGPLGREADLARAFGVRNPGERARARGAAAANQYGPDVAADPRVRAGIDAAAAAANTQAAINL